MVIFVYANVENIVEKGENAGYKHLLLFPQCFQRYSKKLIFGTVWKRVKKSNRLIKP